MPSASSETAAIGGTARPRAALGPALTALAASGVLAFALTTADEYRQHLLTWVALNAVLAVGLRFVLLVGETNIATGAFYGIAAYVSAVCTVNFALPFPASLLAGAAVATAVSAAFGLVTLRTKGPYFM